jgi:hypothetical protein
MQVTFFCNYLVSLLKKLAVMILFQDYFSTDIFFGGKQTKTELRNSKSFQAELDDLENSDSMNVVQKINHLIYELDQRDTTNNDLQEQLKYKEV